MFNNVGGKIKNVARGVGWYSIIMSFLVGAVILAKTGEAKAALIMLFGPLFSWFGMIMLYGFGQLVENSDILVSQISDAAERRISPSDATVKVGVAAYQQRCDRCGAAICGEYCPTCDKALIDRINTIAKWKADGLITEEEYQQKMELLKNEKR